VDPTLQRLKLKYDDPLSNVAFNFNSRRYSEVPRRQQHQQISERDTQGRAVQVDTIKTRVESAYGAG